MSLMQEHIHTAVICPLGIVGWFGYAEGIGRFSSAAYLVVFANLVAGLCWDSTAAELSTNLQRIRTSAGSASSTQPRIRDHDLPQPPGLACAVHRPWHVQTDLWTRLPSLSRVRSSGFRRSRRILTVPTYLMSATPSRLESMLGDLLCRCEFNCAGWSADGMDSPGNMGAGPVEAGATALLCAAPLGVLSGNPLCPDPQRPRKRQTQTITSSRSEPDDLSARFCAGEHTFAEEQS